MTEKVRHVFANNNEFEFYWYPDDVLSDFGSLFVYSRRWTTRDEPSLAIVIEHGTLRPRFADMPKSLIDKGMYYVRKGAQEALEADWDEYPDPRTGMEKEML